MKEDIRKAVEDGIKAIEFLHRPESIAFIEKASDWIVECLEKKGKLLIAGNGGSLCDAMHFAEELSGFFRKKRRALGAMALSDPGHMSCTANDAGYDFVFSRGVEALGREGDLFIGLTTSGNSLNLLYAIQKAKELGLKTISFLGKGGGKIKGMSDLEWIVEGFSTSDRIQEAHMTAIHILIEIVEKKLFSRKFIETCPSH
jgi:D-sedoheptulose 7-phosphate isomerase